MKTIALIIIGIAFVSIATCSLTGKAITDTVTDRLHEVTSPDFDVRLARNAISGLRQELVVDHRHLLALQRDVRRTEEAVHEIGEDIARIGAQIEAGGAMLAQEGPYEIDGTTYNAGEIEAQLEIYITARANRRQVLRQREEQLIRLRHKLSEMTAAVATKQATVEDYEAQIAMLEIDVRFQSAVDRYEVSTGNTRVQAIIDRLSDKVEAGRAQTARAPGIDFTQQRANLRTRIDKELSQQ